MNHNADTVAEEHTITELYIGSIKLNVKGNKNNINPVTLFKIVCMDTSFLLEISPQTTLPILMIAIITIQFHNQVGNSINGSIFTKQVHDVKTNGKNRAIQQIYTT